MKLGVIFVSIVCIFNITLMKKHLSALLLLTGFSGAASAQNAYEIKVSIKNCIDQECYLTKYTWDKPYLVDTAKVDKSGNMEFTGKQKLEKGIYSIYSSKRGMLYFDFIVDESQKLTFATDTTDFHKNMKIAGPKENQDFEDFVKFMGGKNQERALYEKDVRAKKLADSTKLLSEKSATLYKEIKKYQSEYLAKNPKNYIATIIRLQNDPEVPEPPATLKEKKDKDLWQYNYYKNHFWDGIPLNDHGTLNTNKIFADKFKRYFEKVIVQHPDTVIAEADKMIKATEPNKELFKYITHNITVLSENSKIMGMDAVFVHMVNKYYRTRLADWVDENVLQKMLKRADILEPLLIGKVSPELKMMDTTGVKTAVKLGMDTITDSKRLTEVYYKNLPAFEKLFVALDKVKAKYTVLVFWDVDCGHCKKEIPLILDAYHKLRKEGIDVEVFAVYNHHEYDKWRKFIIEYKLDWINVADGVHLNNLTEKFDIYSTPVIYILDQNKIIKAKRVGGEQVEEVIRMMSKEKKTPEDKKSEK